MLEQLTERQQRDQPNWLNQILTSSLLVALIGAIPQYGQWVWAWQHEMPANQVDQAVEQRRLWEANLDCYKRANSYLVNTVMQEVIELTVCPNTGDLLLKLEIAGNPPVYRWIAHRQLRNLESDVALASGLPAAPQPALPLPALKQSVLSASNVLCQTTDPSSGQIIRIVENPDGTCTEEWIDPYTGAVIRQTPTECRSC